MKAAIFAHACPFAFVRPHVPTCGPAILSGLDQRCQLLQRKPRARSWARNCIAFSFLKILCTYTPFQAGFTRISIGRKHQLGVAAVDAASS